MSQDVSERILAVGHRRQRHGGTDRCVGSAEPTGKNAWFTAGPDGSLLRRRTTLC